MESKIQDKPDHLDTNEHSSIITADLTSPQSPREYMNLLKMAKNSAEKPPGDSLFIKEEELEQSAAKDSMNHL